MGWSLLVLASCVPPTPGVIYWEVCLAYGPNPEKTERRPDGTFIQQLDRDTDEAVKTVMRACRD